MYVFCVRLIFNDVCSVDFTLGFLCMQVSNTGCLLSAKTSVVRRPTGSQRNRKPASKQDVFQCAV